MAHLRCGFDHPRRRVGDDGRVTHLEEFDADRPTEALARLDALVLGATEGPAVRFENAATRLGDRFREAWEARD